MSRRLLRKATFVVFFVSTQAPVSIATPRTTHYHAFRPVLDGQLFTDTPTRLIKKGDFRKVPLIVGFVSISPFQSQI